MDKKYQLTPGMSGNKRAWILQSVEKTAHGGIVTNTIAWFSTIKAAKAMASHMRRKPIAV